MTKRRGQWRVTWVGPGPLTGWWPVYEPTFLEWLTEPALQVRPFRWTGGKR